ncbi:MAG: discoidin domain-containing protein [Geminicoccaceae bacterium]
MNANPTLASLAIGGEPIVTPRYDRLLEDFDRLPDGAFGDDRWLQRRTILSGHELIIRTADAGKPNTARIDGGALVAPRTVYLMGEIEGQELSLSAEISITALPATFAFILSAGDPETWAGNNAENSIHAEVTVSDAAGVVRGSSSVHLIDAGNAQSWSTQYPAENHGGITHVFAPMATDGRRYKFRLSVRGDILTLRYPDGSVRSMVKPGLANYVGRFVGYELYIPSSGPDMPGHARIHRLDAETISGSVGAVEEYFTAGRVFEPAAPSYAALIDLYRAFPTNLADPTVKPTGLLPALVDAEDGWSAYRYVGGSVVDHAAGQTPVAGGEDSGYEAVRATDGNVTTAWLASGGKPRWLEVTLSTPIPVGKIDIFARNGADHDRVMGALITLYDVDGDVICKRRVSATYGAGYARDDQGGWIALEAFAGRHVCARVRIDMSHADIGIISLVRVWPALVRPQLGSGPRFEVRRLGVEAFSPLAGQVMLGRLANIDAWLFKASGASTITTNLVVPAGATSLRKLVLHWSKDGGTGIVMWQVIYAPHRQGESISRSHTTATITPSPLGQFELVASDVPLHLDVAEVPFISLRLQRNANGDALPTDAALHCVDAEFVVGD